MSLSPAKGNHHRRGRASQFGNPPVPPSPRRTRRAEPGASDDLVRAFVVRAGRALDRIARMMPRERLLQAVGAASDTDVLYRSLQDAAAIGSEISPDVPDPLTRAMLRGADMKRQMLKAEGGVLSARRLAQHLGITPQGVGKKRDRNQVFWFEVGDGYLYPAFQVGRNGLMPGIREVLNAFLVTDPWMRVSFTLTGDRRLNNRRPIDLLRQGMIDEAVRAAAAYGEHGAA